MISKWNGKSCPSSGVEYDALQNFQEFCVTNSEELNAIISEVKWIAQTTNFKTFID